LASTGIWNVALGSAVSLLNFGRIEGQINAAQAREKQAFEQYRKTVLNAVSEIETALVDYTYINQQYISLESAYEAAKKSLDLSQLLYKEGEISFLDVLDAQRSTNNSESAMISAKSAQVESVVRLFKSLGVY
jgi:outer membrane protein TolC